MTSATENLTSLEVAILRELNCRTDLMDIPVLVEDHGVEVKAVLVSMWKKGLVSLVGSSGRLNLAAKRVEMTEEQYLAGCISQFEGQLLSHVELKREQSFDF